MSRWDSEAAEKLHQMRVAGLCVSVAREAEAVALLAIPGSAAAWWTAQASESWVRAVVWILRAAS